MPSLNTTTVSINKANTKALRELSKMNKKTVGTMVNEFVAEGLKQQAIFDERRRTMFPNENYLQAHICHLRLNLVTQSILEGLKVETINDLLKLTEIDMMVDYYFRRHNAKKRIAEIKDALAYIGLKLAD